MKKIFALISVLILVALILVGCGNYDMFDTVYTYDRAILSLPDGTVIEGKVQSWSDYEDGDQIQVKINGITYLIHSEDCVLIAE